MARGGERCDVSVLAARYCRAVAELSLERGEARVTDLAAWLGVSHVTVTKTIDRLVRDGLATREPYRKVYLTRAGLGIVRRTRARASRIEACLRRLGVPAAAARRDAESAEPWLSDDTLRAMAKRGS